jgi:hypothetical protein
MAQRARRIAIASITALALGCGEKISVPEQVPIAQVPTKVLDVAKKQLPGYDFDRAWKTTADGENAYEIRGQNDQGKVRDVKVTVSGKVVEID